jgi:hypothetical protein
MDYLANPPLDGPKVHYTLGPKHILVSLSKARAYYRTRHGKKCYYRLLC